MKKDDFKNKFCDVVFPLPLDQKYTYYIPEHLSSVNLLGSRVEVDFGREKNKIGIVVNLYEKLDEHNKLNINQIKPIKSIVDTSPFFDMEQLDTASWLAKFYLVSWGYSLNQFFPINHRFTMKEGILLKKNELSKEDIIYNFLNDLFPKKTLKSINLFIPSDRQEKFDFYNKIILYVLEKNLQLIILFPNTTYIYDFYNFILKHNEINNNLDKIILYTGDIPLQERYEMWYLVKNKLVNVIISTKIGIFLPFNNLHLIVVDEPDSLGYINPEIPMYNGLYVLEKRIKNYKFKLIYSSFSPSINYVNKSNLISKKKLLQLNKNIKINVVKKNLLKVITKNIYKFKQILIIFPYKGTQGSYICLSCKKIFSKSVFKKITKSKGMFICPECTATYYKEHLPIVKKVMEFLKDNIKPAIIEDILGINGEKKQQNTKIEDFNNKKIDILITDLNILNYIYKIDIGSVGSIYFAVADEFLNKPNYLTYENFYRLIKTFCSLIPKDKTIEFYVEVFSNNDKFFSLINDYNIFYKEEIKVRKELKYPPFAHIIKLQILDKNEKIVLDFKDKILKSFEKEKNIKIFVEKEIEKNYKGYNTVLIIKLLDVNMIDNIMQEMNNLKKETKCFLGVQHNPLI